MRRLLTLSILLALAAGCSSGPSAPASSGRGAPRDAASLVASIRAAGKIGNELDVQPLRDPQVQDLRDRAESLEAQGQTRQAEALIDQALAISTDDPDLLQWKAELAVYRKDWALAEQFAARSYQMGPRLGGLCRRNWTTLQHARSSRGDAAGAATAKQSIDACRVAPPVRM
jgi:hypothetical protein